MIVDLSNLLKAEGSKIRFDSVMKVDELEFNGDLYSFPEPVNVSGNVFNAGNVLELKAAVSGCIHVKCYRCMREIQRDFSFAMDETLTNDDASEAEEAIRFEGHRIEIDDIVINHILLNTSMKYLCSEDCKGLCSACGADLNEGVCGCKNEDVDPRLEVLKKLLEE